MEKSTLRGHLYALICVLIWGTTFISTKVLLQELTPIEILFIRFSLGFIALCIFCPKLLRGTDKKQELYFAAAGLCGVTLYFLLENIALTYTFASNVAIILSVAPFFTALISRIFLKDENLSPNFFIGFVFALMGIGIISFNGSTNFQLNPMGDILALFAAIVWACYSVITKKISAFGYNTVLTTRRIFLYGLIFMIPALLIMEFSPTLETLLKPTYLFNILFLGFGASALCFVIWNISLKIIGPVKTSAYIYGSPVVTVIASAIFLDEAITPMMLLGVSLAILGLIISEYKRKKPIQEEVS